VSKKCQKRPNIEAKEICRGIRDLQGGRYFGEGGEALGFRV